MALFSTATATAAPMEVLLKGKPARMAPLTDKDIAELDNWLKARVIRMARQAIDETWSEEEKRTLYAAAVANATTLTWVSGEGAKLMNTLDGMSQVFWQCFRRYSPRVTLDEVRAAMLDPESRDEMQEAFATLHGLNEKEDEAKKNEEPQLKTPEAA